MDTATATVEIVAGVFGPLYVATVIAALYVSSCLRFDRGFELLMMNITKTLRLLAGTNLSLPRSLPQRRMVHEDVCA
jgi:hypothetical protein